MLFAPFLFLFVGVPLGLAGGVVGRRLWGMWWQLEDVDSPEYLRFRIVTLFWLFPVSVYFHLLLGVGFACALAGWRPAAVITTIAAGVPTIMSFVLVILTGIHAGVVHEG